MSVAFLSSYSHRYLPTLDEYSIDSEWYNKNANYECHERIMGHYIDLFQEF
jgi:hypothetical protein